jgi:hypothetical protein
MRKDVDELVKHTWFMDQYRHPHESKHTYGEVMRWFSEAGFVFVNSVPTLRSFETFSDKEKLFDRPVTNGILDRFLTQTALMFSGHRDGGFFLMIGKKTSDKRERECRE